MTDEDWLRILDQAADLGAEMVQFIGGEPTLHPALPTLICHALKVGIQVEVFSNLLHLSPALWKVFGRDGVRLACSYYSDEASQHEAVTGRSLSHAKTRANIAEAVARSIPLRVGVIDLGDTQRVRPAIAELESLGVLTSQWIICARLVAAYVTSGQVLNSCVGSALPMSWRSRPTAMSGHAYLVDG
jgi:MoaA/NifB/PqqE/SkfB family radical SAM enzyme